MHSIFNTKNRKRSVIFMPIYKMDGKKDGLQKYRVRINYTDSSGKAKQIDRVAYGKDSAKELERQLMHNLSNETLKRITLQELYDEYIAVKKFEVRENSMRTITGRLELYVLPKFKDYKLNKITSAELQKWKQYIETCTQAKKPKEKLSSSMKKNIFGEFRALMNYAVKMEYIQKNPLTVVGNFRNPYENKKEMDFYTPEEFKKYIQAAKKQAELSEQSTGSIYEWNFYVFFNIAFYTGMRKGEINALKWSDIDDNIIHVRRSIAQKLKGEDRETPPKNQSSVRDLQMPLPLINILNEHQKRYKAIDGYSDNLRICGGIKCLRDTTIEKRNEKFADIANVKKIRIHDFRHPYVKLKLKNSSAYHCRIFGTKVLDFPLDFKPVIGIYAHLFNEHIRKCLC